MSWKYHSPCPSARLHKIWVPAWFHIRRYRLATCDRRSVKKKSRRSTSENGQFCQKKGPTDAPSGRGLERPLKRRRPKVPFPLPCSMSAKKLAPPVVPPPEIFPCWPRPPLGPDRLKIGPLEMHDFVQELAPQICLPGSIPDPVARAGDSQYHFVCMTAAFHQKWAPAWFHNQRYSHAGHDRRSVQR
jgi:hypothetical protein